jgi:hypothetical protein
MAINQFNITLIPRQPIVDKYGSVPTKLFVDHIARQKHFDNDFEAEFDFEDDLTVNWWRHNKIKFADIEPNVTLLLRPIEWTEKYDDFKSYGDNNDNDISISLTDKINIDEFDCRIANSTFAPALQTTKLLQIRSLRESYLFFLCKSPLSIYLCY